MMQDQLKQQVDSGDTILAPAADATLKREGTEYVMAGASGEHRLLADATADRRLAAHWHGFTENGARALR
jgi:hypothetical protein